MAINMYGNILEFRFLNINLPDSGASYLGSMGHITYRIYQQPGLVPLTEIPNRAGIFFDYNAPIITNQTLNTIENPTSIARTIKMNENLRLYPNPAGDIINIVATDQYCLLIMDLNGKTMLKKNNCSKHSTIDISELKQGVYFVRVNNGQSIETARIIKL